LTLMLFKGLNFLRSSPFCTWLFSATCLETFLKANKLFQTCCCWFRHSFQSSLRMNPSAPGSVLPASWMSGSLSYLRISFFLFQALTELNLHLFSRLVRRYLSYKVHLSFTHPCGLSLLMVVLRENRFCNLFIFHYPVPWNRLADFISGW